MKQPHYFILLCILLALTTGCVDNGTSGHVSKSDSIYTRDNIVKYLFTDPELGLRMIDTAETRGVIDVNQANYARGYFYYSSDKIQDLDKTRDYMLKVLNNKKPAVDSATYIKVLNCLTAVYSATPSTYQDAIQYALEGAQRAHNANDLPSEANFYYIAGSVMERMQYGSGMKYLENTVEIYKKLVDSNPQMLPSLSNILGVISRFAGEKGYANAIPYLKERLQIVERIEKEGIAVPDGFCNQERASTYGLLAVCQLETGDISESKKSAEAFEKVKDTSDPVFQEDIMLYYAYTGDVARVQQIYDKLEPIIRKREDTLSLLYQALVEEYAIGLNEGGRYQEAYHTLKRSNMLKDSLTQHERQQETLKYAQQLRTQEKELQLKDEEAKSAIYRILAAAAFLICLLIAYFLWRSHIYNKVLLAKNRRLLAEIEERERQEQQAIEQLQAEPEETLTPSQQLFRRICTLMTEQQPYTDENLNRDVLAQLLGTNAKYVGQAIHECSHDETVTDFITRYRLEHVARLLKTTDDPIAIIGEMSGIPSRATLARLFRNAYGMTCTEFREVAREKQ